VTEIAVDLLAQEKGDCVSARHPVRFESREWS
jgi:hypothetical protein